MKDFFLLCIHQYPTYSMMVVMIRIPRKQLSELHRLISPRGMLSCFDGGGCCSLTLTSFIHTTHASILLLIPVCIDATAEPELLLTPNHRMKLLQKQMLQVKHSALQSTQGFRNDENRVASNTFHTASDDYNDCRCASFCLA